MQDEHLFKLLSSEQKRQTETLNCIASENYPSPEIREILASCLNSKYAEGIPGKRYYPGNEIIDDIERLAVTRIKETFHLDDAWHVNVQPYSGTPANLAIYRALLQSGDSILGMSLPSGGHLSHGHPITASGTLYTPHTYSVDEKTFLLDYDAILEIAKKVHPKLIIAGGSAYSRTIDFEAFRKIADEVGAYLMADISHIAGPIVAGLHPSPFPYADVVMTTTHKTLRGPRGAIIIAKEQFAKAIDSAVFPGLQGGPHLATIAGIAQTFFEAQSDTFKEYQKQILKNANAMVEVFFKNKTTKNAVISGGTDNHLFLLDVRPFSMDGFTAEKELESVGILANRNSLPFDTKPYYPSGIRIGTPAITTRGINEKDAMHIAELIIQTLSHTKEKSEIISEVKRLCDTHPIW